MESPVVFWPEERNTVCAAESEFNPESYKESYVQSVHTNLNNYKAQSRRILNLVNGQQPGQDFVCSKSLSDGVSWYLLSLLKNMKYFHHLIPNLSRDYPEMHPKAQPKPTWDNWPLKTVGLAALLAVACPSEALDIKQAAEPCEKSHSSYWEHWPEDFINSGVCGDG